MSASEERLKQETELKAKSIKDAAGRGRLLPIQRIGELIELTHARQSLQNATDADTADINAALCALVDNSTQVPDSAPPSKKSQKPKED